MNATIFLRTKPEIIKSSSIIHECEQNNLNFFILHTGQHFSYKMNRVFFEQLGFSDTIYNPDIDSSSHEEQTERMLRPSEFCPCQ